MPRHLPTVLIACLCGGLLVAAAPPEHPRLFFSRDDLTAIRGRAADEAMRPVAERLAARATSLLTAPPIVPSLAKRGEPDPPGELKGIESARRLQGRVATLALAFRLQGQRAFRDAAMENLRRAIEQWRIWVDTAHAPPYDLMSGELALTVAIGYDWLYDDLSPDERALLERGAARLFANYLEAVERKAFWYSAEHNWNPVCNGGAAVLALSMLGHVDAAERVLDLAAPAMDPYWKHLADDGGWDEGTGYWAYGHRYAFMAAEALRRAGRRGGDERFSLPGAARTGWFPIVFNPGRTLSASFGDSASRAEDPIFYLLARHYREPAFAWFQDRATPRDVGREGWPQEALALIWRPTGEAWMPERTPGYTPRLDVPALFGSIGWGMLASRLPDPPSFLAFKNGSLAANHTHLDLNAIAVGRGEEMLLVELGSRPYPADYFQADARYAYYEIGTRGHNTALVGGRGQVLGRAGRLLAPRREDGLPSLVGIADGTYEVETPRARRHVVQLPDDTYVVVDELATAAPQTVELRFHTYGSVAGSDRRFVVTGQASALDLVVASAGSTARVEHPDGWIRPVHVVSVTRPASAAHTSVVVLHPRAATDPPLSDVVVTDEASALVVEVGGRPVRFVRDRGGLRLDTER